LRAGLDPDLANDLFDDRADKCFVDLHDPSLDFFGVLLAAVYVALFDTHGVDNSDDHTVDRKLAGFGSKPCAAPLGDQNHIANACSEGIDSDEGSARRDQALSILGLESKRFDQEQLLAGHGIYFLGRYNRAGHFGNKHDLSLLKPRWVTCRWQLRFAELRSIPRW
ncbi:MAG: hypothetical protein RJB11_842, partial [Planctomycetota bacterium]